jgi:hypothetical protein
MSGAKLSREEAAEILGSRSGRSGVSAIGFSGRRPHQREREMGQTQQMTTAEAHLNRGNAEFSPAAWPSGPQAVHLRSGTFRMGRRMGSLIGPKDIVSHGRVQIYLNRYCNKY